MEAFETALRLREELRVDRDDLRVLPNGEIVAFFEDGGEVVVGTLRRNGRRWTVDRSAFDADSVEADTRRDALDRLATLVTDARVDEAPDPSGLTMAQARRIRQEVQRSRDVLRARLNNLDEYARRLRSAAAKMDNGREDPRVILNDLGEVQGAGYGSDVAVARAEAAKDALGRALRLAADLRVELEPSQIDEAVRAF